jgi:transcriptional regulator with XRE-family HTH domain
VPEIGAALREARMRQRIDISEIEARTKIRAKYLRALENEEWDLLPGPTFVKSFLRTYAEALGLDARLLMEEYKLRHERLSEHELLPIAPPGSQRDRPRRGPPPGIGRDVAVAVLVVALVGLLIILGNNSDSGTNTSSKTTPTTPAHTSTTKGKSSKGKHRKTPAAAKFAKLQLVPSGPVWVCLQAAGNRTILGGEVIDPTTKLSVYRSSRFRMTFGNNSLAMKVNGKTLKVPDVSDAIGYEVTRSGHRRVLSSAERPTCS